MVEVVDNGRRSAGRREQSEYDFPRKSDYSDFRHGRRVRQLGPAAFACHRKCLQLACLEVREQGGPVVEEHIDVPTEQDRDHWSGTLVRDKDDVRACLSLEELGTVTKVNSWRGTVAQFAGILLRMLDELLKCVRGHLWRYG